MRMREGAAASEPLWAGQIRSRDGVPFWDVWTSFKPGALEPLGHSKEPAASEVSIGSFRIRAISRRHLDRA